jgi:sugar diacid utilization regulator
MEKANDDRSAILIVRQSEKAKEHEMNKRRKRPVLLPLIRQEEHAAKTARTARQVKTSISEKQKQ